MIKKKVGRRSQSLACPTLRLQSRRNKFPDALPPKMAGPHKEPYDRSLRAKIK
jgi:hypothetical protein